MLFQSLFFDSSTWNGRMIFQAWDELCFLLNFRRYEGLHAALALILSLLGLPS
jgi:hypothetical protein